MASLAQDSTSIVGRIFLAGLGRAALGQPSGLKLRGSQQQADCIKHAIEAAQAFHDVLGQDDVMVQDVMDALDAKKQACAEFEACFGLKWPL